MTNPDTIFKITFTNIIFKRFTLSTGTTMATIRGNICLFSSEPIHDLKIKASTFNSPPFFFFFTTKAYTKCLPWSRQLHVDSLSSSSFRTIATKMTTTKANTEQVFPLQGAKSLICIILFHPHRSQQREQGQDPLPCSSQVQKVWKPSVLLICGANSHCGTKLTCEDNYNFSLPNLV